MSATAPKTFLADPAVRTFVVRRLRGHDGMSDEDFQVALRLGATPVGDGLGQAKVLSQPYPDDVSLPIILVSRYGTGITTGAIGRGLTQTSSLEYQVRALCEGYDDAPILEAGDLMNQLLDNVTDVVTVRDADGGSLGDYQVECWRTGDLLSDLPVEDDGTVYQHQGGVYAFFVTRL